MPYRCDHTTIEGLRLEGTLKITSFQPPCHGQGCQPLHQAARGPSGVRQGSVPLWAGCGLISFLTKRPAWLLFA